MNQNHIKENIFKNKIKQFKNIKNLIIYNKNLKSNKKEH